MNPCGLPQEIIDHYAKYKKTHQKLVTTTILSSKFEIDDNYDIIDNSSQLFLKILVGQGAYGIVVAAKDKNLDPENNFVAIKKIEKAFEHKIFTKRTLRELRLLRLLKHENIIGINTIICPKSREELEDMYERINILQYKYYSYVVQELMETDLAQIIKSNQSLTDEHCQFFLYQLLRGLKYVHSADVVHRDLKPRNLLVNSNCDLKICDFGLARALIPDLKFKAGVLTDYVATRWYRAPELLLSWKDYTSAVDVWSVGCILAELIRRKPFLPGCDTKNQIELIFEIIGTPSEQELNMIPREKYRLLAKQLPRRPGKQFEKLFPDASPMAIDLLRKLLTFDASKRITVEEALRHPFLSSLHFPDDEPLSVPVQRLDFEFEEFNLTLQQLKGINSISYPKIVSMRKYFSTIRRSFKINMKQIRSRAILLSIISQIIRMLTQYINYIYLLKKIDPDADEDDEESDDNGAL